MGAVPSHKERLSRLNGLCGMGRLYGLPHRIKSGPYLWGKERLLRCGEWDAGRGCFSIGVAALKG